MPASKRPDSSTFRAELRKLIRESVNETLIEHRIVELQRGASRSRLDDKPKDGPAPRSVHRNVVSLRPPGSVER